MRLMITTKFVKIFNIVTFLRNLYTIVCNVCAIQISIRNIVNIYILLSSFNEQTITTKTIKFFVIFNTNVLYQRK